ncbi:gephyrin-like molybdotransferase Glp [Acidobacteriota bacterium]
MISVDEALKKVMELTPQLPPVRKSLAEIGSNVLAEDVCAQSDVPMFTNSAMDGFAVHSEDISSVPVSLKLRGAVKAGDNLFKKMDRGEAIKIMTGAPLPDGADAVVMVEYTEQKGDTVIVNRTVKTGENVRFQGDEIKRGEIGLEMGTRINPASAGFLASLGRGYAEVFAKPRVGIVVTGDELVPPGLTLKPGQIWESNSTTVKSALSEFRIVPIYSGNARDTREDLKEHLRDALEASDILLVCGGISVGDYDFVQETLLGLGVERSFWRVAIKPGKPTFFGTQGEKLVFGLPGNPASVLVTYLIFVRPAILRMMGRQDIHLPQVEAVLEEDLTIKGDRTNYMRGIFQRSSLDGISSVRRAGLQTSSILESFSRANCLIILEKGKTEFKRGESVKIAVLPWS